MYVLVLCATASVVYFGEHNTLWAFFLSVIYHVLSAIQDNAVYENISLLHVKVPLKDTIAFKSKSSGASITSSYNRLPIG